jgi:AcrR family transcriptional regulator
MGPVYKPEYYEFLYEKSSRNRILVTAKTLFASLGYDNTSTAVIARNAGTSESQLMKHFGGKAGLLETIFTEGWSKINTQLEDCFKSAADLSGKLSCVPTVVLNNLDQDLELKTLVLLEGHRMREVAQNATGKRVRALSLADRRRHRARRSAKRIPTPGSYVASAFRSGWHGGRVHPGPGAGNPGKFSRRL